MVDSNPLEAHRDTLRNFQGVGKFYSFNSLFASFQKIALRFTVQKTDANKTRFDQRKMPPAVVPLKM